LNKIVTFLDLNGNLESCIGNKKIYYIVLLLVWGFFAVILYYAFNITRINLNFVEIMFFLTFLNMAMFAFKEASELKYFLCMTVVVVASVANFVTILVFLLKILGV